MLMSMPFCTERSNAGASMLSFPRLSALKHGRAFAIKNGGMAQRHTPDAESLTTHSFSRCFEDGLQLLGQHHVSLNLQLTSHEGLHAIKLALSHGDHVSIRDGDSHICS
mmetsp:Transcript_22996/g.44081  ORF Transcript_22996/g.44081 Transcript_22996/m.44081 type:complete len:109 (+) Transcript_22996:29-355(+)